MLRLDKCYFKITYLQKKLHYKYKKEGRDLIIEKIFNIVFGNVKFLTL